MGSAISVDNPPVPLPHLLTQRKNLSTRAHDFNDNVKAWKFHETSRNGVESLPVNLSTGKEELQNVLRNSDRCCFVVLHTYYRTGSSSTFQPSTLWWATPLMDSLTPRGIEQVFSSWECAANDISFSLYIWNGKEASGITKATALVKGFELEKSLTSTNQLRHSVFYSSTVTAAEQGHKAEGGVGGASQQQQQQQQPTNITPVKRNHLFSKLGQGTTVPGVSGYSTPRTLGSFRSPTTTTGGRVVGGTATDTAATPKQVAPSSLARLLGLPSRDPTPSPVVTPPSTAAGRGRQPATEETPPNSAAHEKRVGIVLPPDTPTDSTSNSPTSPVSCIPHSYTLGDAAKPEATPSRKNTRRSLSMPSLQIPSRKAPSHLTRLKITAHKEESDLPSPLTWSRMHAIAMTATQISGYLFVGAEHPAKDKDLLHKYGITHIMNMASMVCRCHFPSEFSYECINLLDSADENMTPIFPFVVHCVERIRQRNGVVYIHCYQGVSRSCSATIAYLMWRDHITYEEAFETVRSQRQVCSPNHGFINNLMRWQQQLFAKRQYQLLRLGPFSIKYPLPFVLHEDAVLVLEVEDCPTNTKANSRMSTPSTGGSNLTSNHELSVSSHPVVQSPLSPPTPCTTSHLDIRTCYVLITPSEVFTWQGAECPARAYQALTKLIPIFLRYSYPPSFLKFLTAEGVCNFDEIKEIKQNGETEEFWDAMAFIASDGVKIMSNPSNDHVYGKPEFDKFLDMLEHYEEADSNERAQFQSSIALAARKHGQASKEELGQGVDKSKVRGRPSSPHTHTVSGSAQKRRQSLTEEDGIPSMGIVDPLSNHSTASDTTPTTCMPHTRNRRRRWSIDSSDSSITPHTTAPPKRGGMRHYSVSSNDSTTTTSSSGGNSNKKSKGTDNCVALEIDMNMPTMNMPPTTTIMDTNQATSHCAYPATSSTPGLTTTPTTYTTSKMSTSLRTFESALTGITLSEPTTEPPTPTTLPEQVFLYTWPDLALAETVNGLADFNSDNMYLLTGKLPKNDMLQLWLWVGKNVNIKEYCCDESSFVNMIKSSWIKATCQDVALATHVQQQHTDTLPNKEFLVLLKQWSVTDKLDWRAGESPVKQDESPEVD